MGGGGRGRGGGVREGWGKGGEMTQTLYAHMSKKKRKCNVCSVILFIHKEKWNYVIGRKIDEARDLHVKPNEQVSDKYNVHNL
jgi:hypothetical protein